MRHWIGAPQIDLHVRYATETGDNVPVKSAPTFIGSERISGEAVFTLKKKYEGLRYRIIVKGNVQANIANNLNGSLNGQPSLETHTFYSAVIFDGTKAAVTSAGSKVKVLVPFDFTIQEPNINSQILLPSLDSRTGNRHWFDAFKSDVKVDYQVTYTVIASVLLDKKIVVSMPRQFHFIPTSDVVTPIGIEDYPGEYAVRASKILQKRPCETRIGVISHEPTALMICKENTQPTTNISLLLMLVRDSSTSELPPKAYNIQALLQANTFVLPQKSRPELHTIQSIRFSGAVVKQRTSSPQSHVGVIKQWESHDSESEDDGVTSIEEILTTEVTVPFTIDSNQSLTPSFWSPLLSRRYTIELSVTLDDDPDTLTKLRLPVQVIHERDA